MEKNKETLADIVRQKTPTSRGRRKSKSQNDLPKTLFTDLDSEKLKAVDLLFENAQFNIIKLEEERAANKSKTEEVLAPKIKIVNGKVVIDKDNLINACAQSELNVNDLVKVQESGMRSKNVRKKHNERWNEEETQLFYTVRLKQALQLFGTDFEMISNFMKNRNRNQIKSKYKKESKLNPIRIDHAIWNRIPLSKESYQYYIKKFDFTKQEDC